MSGRTRVFQIGFNRCGTHTIHSFFERNGFASVHWDHGKLARAIFANLQNGRSLVSGYEDCDVFTDMEFISKGVALEAFKLFPYLANEFPDALFILNTRDREAWVKSRLLHDAGRLAMRWKNIHSVETDEELAAKWRADWDRHHERVHAFFSSHRYRLVVLNIEKDSADVIARALPTHQLELSYFRHLSKTKIAEPV